MNEDLLALEPTLRFCVVALAVALVAVWEGTAPRRRSFRNPLRSRWRVNFGLWVLDLGVMRLAGPSFAVGLALLTAERGGGLLPLLGGPWWLTFALTLLVLDLAKYVEHWLFHRVSVLWRIHRVHHADADYDFTVGFRFHPLEALISVALTMAAIVALGPPPLAVLTHQLLLLALSMFAHGNVRMPAVVDAVLRRCVVTPDMHRVHHSAALQESSANLGSVVPWWDRLFGTYVAEPAAGHDRMTFGLGGPTDPRHLKIGWLLLEPFRAAAPPAPGPARPSAARAHAPSALP